MNEVLICSKCKMRVSEWIIENMGLWLYASDDYFIYKTVGWKCPNCEKINLKSDFCYEPPKIIHR